MHLQQRKGACIAEVMMLRAGTERGACSRLRSLSNVLLPHSNIRVRDVRVVGQSQPCDRLQLQHLALSNISSCEVT